MQCFPTLKFIRRFGLASFTDYFQVGKIQTYTDADRLFHSYSVKYVKRSIDNKIGSVYSNPGSMLINFFSLNLKTKLSFLNIISDIGHITNKKSNIQNIQFILNSNHRFFPCFPEYYLYENVFIYLSKEVNDKTLIGLK